MSYKKFAVALFKFINLHLFNTEIRKSDLLRNWGFKIVKFSLTMTDYITLQSCNYTQSHIITLVTYLPFCLKILKWPKFWF